MRNMFLEESMIGGTDWPLWEISPIGNQINRVRDWIGYDIRSNELHKVHDELAA